MPTRPIASTEAVSAPRIPGAPAWLDAYSDHWVRLLQRQQQRLDQSSALRGMAQLNGVLDAQGNRIAHLPDPTDADHPVTLGYLREHALVKTNGRYVFNGPVDANNQRIQNVGATRTQSDATNRSGVQDVSQGALDTFVTQAHTWTALQTFAAGLSLGNETLAVYDTGSSLLAGTGFTVAPTGAALWVHTGAGVVLWLPSLTGTSNAGTFTITGLDVSIQPTQTSWHVCRVQDGGVDAVGLVRLNAVSSVIDVFATIAAAAFAGAGTKALYPTSLAYTLL